LRSPPSIDTSTATNAERCLTLTCGRNPISAARGQACRRQRPRSESSSSAAGSSGSTDASGFVDVEPVGHRKAADVDAEHAAHLTEGLVEPPPGRAEDLAAPPGLPLKLGEVDGG